MVWLAGCQGCGDWVRFRYLGCAAESAEWRRWRDWVCFAFFGVGRGEIRISKSQTCSNWVRFAHLGVWPSGKLGLFCIMHPDRSGEIRNSNLEIRDKSEIRNLKPGGNWVRFVFFGCWLLAIGGWVGGIGFVSRNWGTACRARTGIGFVLRIGGLGGRRDASGAVNWVCFVFLGRGGRIPD